MSFNLEKAFLVWLKNGTYKHINKILAVPLTGAALTFLGNMLLAVSDGVIDEDEFHTLLQGSSTLQMGILVIVMAVLKSRK